MQSLLMGLPPEWVGATRSYNGRATLGGRYGAAKDSGAGQTAQIQLARTKPRQRYSANGREPKGPAAVNPPGRHAPWTARAEPTGTYLRRPGGLTRLGPRSPSLAPSLFGSLRTPLFAQPSPPLPDGLEECDAGGYGDVEALDRTGHRDGY